MNPNPATTWKHLAPNPKSAYKQLFSKGRRIRARDLYGRYMSAEEPITSAEIAADQCQTNPVSSREINAVWKIESEGCSHAS